MNLLKKGDPAPHFTAKDQNGNIIRFESVRGEKIILYFYPKDDTPGCTAEACNLRDNYDALIKKGFVVIGVSADNEESHQKFIHKYNLPFSLISDEKHDIINSYNAWGEKTMAGKTYEGILRKTYIIGENGTIEHIIDKVDTKNHTQQILEILEK